MDWRALEYRKVDALRTMQLRVAVETWSAKAEAWQNSWIALCSLQITSAKQDYLKSHYAPCKVMKKLLLLMKFEAQRKLWSALTASPDTFQGPTPLLDWTSPPQDIEVQEHLEVGVLNYRDQQARHWEYGCKTRDPVKWREQRMEELDPLLPEKVFLVKWNVRCLCPAWHHINRREMVTILEVKWSDLTIFCLIVTGARFIKLNDLNKAMYVGVVYALARLLQVQPADNL